MLRINLLPAYLAERKRLNLAIIGASALFLLLLGGMLGYHFGLLSPSVAQRETEANDKETEATAVNKIATDTATIRAGVAPLKDKVDYVEAVRFHNQIRQKIFRNAAKYTINTAEYGTMAVTGNTLQIGGYVKKVSDLGRLYITMFGNPDVTAVSIQGIPGWPQALPPPGGQSPFTGPNPETSGWFPVQLTASLVRPVVTPSLPPSLASGGVGGQTGGGGFRGGGPPGGGGGYGAGPPAGFAPGGPTSGAPISSGRPGRGGEGD